MDPAGLARARQTAYQAGTLREIPGGIKAKWFTRDRNLYRLDRSLKEQVRFRQQDLLKDPDGEVLDQVFGLFPVTQHVGRFEVVFQGLGALPLFNDRDHVFVLNLGRRTGIHVHSRKVFEAAGLLPDGRDIGLEDFQKFRKLRLFDPDKGLEWVQDGARKIGFRQRFWKRFR